MYDFGLATPPSLLFDFPTLLGGLRTTLVKFVLLFLLDVGDLSLWIF